MDQGNDKKQPTQTTVYYDGDCTMCQAFRAEVEQPDQQESAKFSDLRTEELPEGIDREKAIEKIHVVTEDGKVLSGAAAVFEILERNNRYVLLAKIGRLPIISCIAEFVYKIVAKNRFRLFRS